MPKVKTHKGSSKRFKVTGTGKVMASKQHRRHNLESKSNARKRRLRKADELSKADSERISKLLPYA